jgi:ribose transport system permease protein
LPPIIATLGAYLFYSGIAAQLLPTPGGTVPGWVIQLAGGFGPIPGTLFVFAGVAVAWILLSRTAYLRNLLMLGGDDRAAYASGVNVGVIRLIAYSLSGLLAALAGLMLVGSLQSADATVGPTFTISSIAAVALGGISLAGGRGGLLGAAIGGGSFYLIQNLLTVASVSVFQLDIADGALLIVALALSAQIEFMRRRRGMRVAAGSQALTEQPLAGL